MAIAPATACCRDTIGRSVLARALVRKSALEPAAKGFRVWQIRSLVADRQQSVRDLTPVNNHSDLLQRSAIVSPSPPLMAVRPRTARPTWVTTDVPGGAVSPSGVGLCRKDEEEHTLNVFERMAGGALMLTLLATVAVAQVAAIDGEVMKINESSGSITLKHGPAPSLGFKEGVTMVYEVRDPAVLKQVKVGDKVKFEAESGDDGFTVTKLQKK
jgi:Cu(I)/Ag(I) efflux system periplasmic protein CusF